MFNPVNYLFKVDFIADALLPGSRPSWKSAVKYYISYNRIQGFSSQCGQAIGHLLFVLVCFIEIFFLRKKNKLLQALKVWPFGQ